MPRRIWLIIVPVAISLAIFAFHLSIIWKSSVNLPFFDDWAAFAGDNHPASVDWSWLLAQHNEHRMATTKLFIWAQFQLNGWNIRTHLALAFLIYGLLVGTIAAVSRTWIRTVTDNWAVWWFIPFFLTPLVWFNLFMAYTVSVHFWLLCFFLATYLVFAEAQSWPRLLTGWMLCVLSIYSWAAGFVTGLVLVLAFCAFKCLRVRSAGFNRKRELSQLLVSITMSGVAFAGWLYHFRKPGHHPPLVWPYQRAFWIFYANLVANGFGIQRISTAAGLVCLAIVLVPLAGLAYQHRARLSARQWALTAAVLSLLINQCAVTMGRAGFGIVNSKISEYAEIGLPLIMLAVVSWIMLLPKRRTLQITALGLLWLLCMVVFWHKWNDFSIYQTQREVRVAGLNCVRAYYQNAGDGYCPSVYPANASLSPALEQARKLNASVYREASR